MSLFRAILQWILILLSVAAGAAKVLQTPQEVKFFADAGLGLVPLFMLGIVQVLGGLLAPFSNFRLAAFSLIFAGFLASVIVILVTGEFAFAMISLLPVLGSGYLIWYFRNG